jgi:hypothetical protein
VPRGVNGVVPRELNRISARSIRYDKGGDKIARAPSSVEDGRQLSFSQTIGQIEKNWLRFANLQL